MSTTAKQSRVPSNEDLLVEEDAFYQRHEEAFLREHQGRHLLIKGSCLIGSYESEHEAVVQGVRRFGCGPFLVRQPGKGPIRASAPALTLGLLSAGSR